MACLQVRESGDNVSTGYTAPIRQPCLLCQGTRYRPIKKFGGGVEVGRCTDCGLLYTPLRHPAPSSLLTGSSVEDLRYCFQPILQGHKRHFRHRNFVDYLQRIERHASGRRLLDVGCAHGFLAMVARARGYEVMAVEPSPPMARFASEEVGIPVLTGRLDEVDLGSRCWDVVTFTDSAEYLPEPLQDLRRVVDRLAPNGVLFLKVPNGDHFRLRHALEAKLGVRIGPGEAFGPALRVAHYTLGSLRRLVELLGLEVRELGACPPVDSPPWYALVGQHLEVESPWILDARERCLRRLFFAAGQIEQRLHRHADHFSPAIYIIARKRQ